MHNATPQSENTPDTPNLLIEEGEQSINPATIPDKFKNPQTGALRLDALVKSYAELEQKMSGRPEEQASAPHSPEEYCINCDHGLFEPDDEINRRLHAQGMTQEQVQEVYDLGAEKMLPMMKELVGDMKADREVDKLLSHFGGPDKWKEVSRQLLAFGQRNLPKDVLDNLSSSFEGVLALSRMMKSEEPSLKPRSNAPEKAGEQELQSMMRDPRYWRDRDPAYVSKVTEGFQDIYGK